MRRYSDADQMDYLLATSDIRNANLLIDMDNQRHYSNLRKGTQDEGFSGLGENFIMKEGL